MNERTSAVDPADDAVVTLLSAAGWDARRSVDIDGWVRALRDDGYTVFLAAERVLSEFGGLAFQPPHRVGARSGPGRVSFTPLVDTAGERARILTRERQLGRRLCPVGEWWDGEYMLLIGEDGHVFAETSYQVIDLGGSIMEALHHLIVRDVPPRDITRELPREG